MTIEYRTAYLGGFLKSRPRGLNPGEKVGLLIKYKDGSSSEYSTEVVNDNHVLQNWGGGEGEERRELFGQEINDAIISYPLLKGVNSWLRNSMEVNWKPERSARKHYGKKLLQEVTVGTGVV